MTRDGINKRDQAAIDQAAAIVLGNQEHLTTRALVVEAARIAMHNERSRIRGNGAPDCAIVVLDLNGDEVARAAVRNDANDVAEAISMALFADGYAKCVTCHEYVKESDCECIDSDESQWCCKSCMTPREPNTATQAAPTA